MARYVATTNRLHELHISAQGGYVNTTYPKYTIDEIWVNETISFQDYSFSVYRVFSSSLMDLECPLLGESLLRWLRRRAATSSLVLSPMIISLPAA